ATPGTGSGLAPAGVLLLPPSETTGSSTTSSCPTLDRPRRVTRRNSCGPSGQSLAAVTLRMTERTAAGAVPGFGAGAAPGFGSGAGAMTAVRPGVSLSQPVASAKFI